MVLRDKKEKEQHYPSGPGTPGESSTWAVDRETRKKSNGENMKDCDSEFMRKRDIKTQDMRQIMRKGIESLRISCMVCLNLRQRAQVLKGRYLLDKKRHPTRGNYTKEGTAQRPSI